jgi:hypothetical protein
VRARVEAPGALLQADGRRDALGEGALPVDGERLVEEGRLDARRVADDLGERRPEDVEDRRHLGRGHERLEVVEERRVGRVLPVEARGITLADIEVALERGEEEREVAGRSRLDPDRVGEGGRAQALGP